MRRRRRRRRSRHCHRDDRLSLTFVVARFSSQIILPRPLNTATAPAQTLRRPHDVRRIGRYGDVLDSSIVRHAVISCRDLMIQLVVWFRQFKNSFSLFSEFLHIGILTFFSLKPQQVSFCSEITLLQSAPWNTKNSSAKHHIYGLHQVRILLCRFSARYVLRILRLLSRIATNRKRRG